MVATETDVHLRLDERYREKLIPASQWRGLTTFVPNKEIPVHSWFHCPQAFSGTLVSNVLEVVGAKPGQRVVDPFGGIGTTAVVAKRGGLRALSIELLPVFCLVARVKNRDYVLSSLEESLTRLETEESQTTDLPSEIPTILRQSFSGEVLLKIFELRGRIERIAEPRDREFFLVALLSILDEISFVRKAGAHYRFVNTDNVGVRHQFAGPTIPGEPYQIFYNKARKMIGDLRQMKITPGSNHVFDPVVVMGDARRAESYVGGPFEYLVTSPPYLNRDSYVAQYKRELFLAPSPHGVTDFREYRDLTFSSLRSHVEAKSPGEVSSSVPEDVNLLCSELSTRELNNPGIVNMVAGYFEDMATCLSIWAQSLTPSGLAVIVVGNVRFAGLHIPVDYLLCKTAERLGFEVLEIAVTRYKLNSPQQMRRYGKFPVRESVIFLRNS